MINFMRYKKLYFLISGLFLIPGVIALFVWGLNPSIDFLGGTVWEFQLTEGQDDFENTAATTESLLRSGEIDVSSVQVNDEGVLQIKMEAISQERRELLLRDIQEEVFADLTERRFESVGPSLGRELLIKTFTAVVLATLTILVYIAWRFKDRMFGVCAVLAMFHDSFIVLGIFSLLGHYFDVEVDALFVTAVLTILSFSVHDTIVVYDRIRELQRKFPKTKFADLINKAVSETLVRSLNNSLTIIFMLSALFLLGGETVRWFVFALLIGTIAGTYSSPFTAAPLLTVWHERFRVKNN